MERVNHIDIVQVSCRRFIGQIDRVLERDIPDRECLKFCITGLNAALVFMVQLGKAGCHLAAARARCRNDDQRAFGLDVLIQEIKSFYMKQNPDGKTVAAMDVLFPQIGEIIGGSQREEDYNKLVTRMQEVGIPVSAMSWYLDTRRFGSAEHSGFGLGFERLLLFVTGMGNIRDVIPFPRTVNNCEL